MMDTTTSTEQLVKALCHPTRRHKAHGLCGACYQQRLARRAPMLDLDEMYHCKGCKEDKPIREFKLDGRMRRGHSNQCRACLALYRRTWRARNASREMDAHLRRKFGITLDDYRGLLAAQRDRCAICHTEAKDSGPQGLVVDHCHATGRVRGLLCTSCNHGLGKFRDDPSRLRSALAYLER